MIGSYSTNVAPLCKRGRVMVRVRVEEVIR